jgi:hypothetical protein
MFSWLTMEWCRVRIRQASSQLEGTSLEEGETRRSRLRLQSFRVRADVLFPRPKRQPLLSIRCRLMVPAERTPSAEVYSVIVDLRL